MTRPKASRYPVSSFGPRLMELLLRGAQEEVRIPCPDMRTMKHIQMRIQMLRGAMGREKHPQYGLSTRARTSCTWDTEKHPTSPKGRFPMEATNCVLIVKPNDAQFDKVLGDAGIEATQAAKDILEEEAIPEAPKNPIIEPTPKPQPAPTPFLSPYDRFKS